MIGASLYLSELDKEYIDNLIKEGITSIFTSLHIPEEDNNIQEVKEILAYGEKKGLSFIVDVSPNTLNFFNVKSLFELKEFGVGGIRLDYGFEDPEEIYNLSKEFQVIFNASTIDKKFVTNLEKFGLKANEIYALHNFYPKNLSGLSDEYFLAKNKELKSLGVKVMAFVPGDSKNRFPTYEGLPTLEKHRGENPYYATLDLFTNFFVDEVFIGDGFASRELLEVLGNFKKDTWKTLVMRVTTTKDLAIFKKPQTKRKDSHGGVIRLLTRQVEEIEQNNIKRRIPGAIGVTNRLYGRYNGEIELYLKEYPSDHRINIIGYIFPEDLPLLEFAGLFEEIKFIRV